MACPRAWCKCHEIEAEIDKEFPDADWVWDEACQAWQKRSRELDDNNTLERDLDDDDLQGACRCQACGRVICIMCT